MDLLGCCRSLCPASNYKLMGYFFFKLKRSLVVHGVVLDISTAALHLNVSVSHERRRKKGCWSIAQQMQQLSIPHPTVVAAGDMSW